MPDRAPSRRILAVDGGQSTIRVRHSDMDEQVEVEGVSRSAITDFEVAEAIERAWIEAGSRPVDLAVLGLTTAPSDEGAALALGSLVGEAIGAPEVWVADDSVTSHAGALSLGWGVSIVAGTGVACLAVPPREGEPRIVGGHGYLLGDEGGAFWIGREAVRAVLRAAEGREEPTDLTALVAERFDGLANLHVRLHDDLRPVNTIAQFARDVFQLADTDPAAMRIIRDAAWELFNVILAAAKLTGSEKVPVGVGGRILAGGNPLRRELDALLGSDDAVRPRNADLPPVEGAMLIGQAGTPGRYASLITAWRAAEAA